MNSLHDAATHDIGTELLRTLIAVVEERSYTRAASRLGLSQPTVSAHVRRLQEQVGYDFFDKSVPGVKLTDQGEFALQRARQILAIHDSMVRGTEDIGSIQDRIRVGIPTEIRWDLAPGLAAARSSNPKANFRVERGASSTLLEKLHAGQLDICAVTQLEDIGPGAHVRWRETLVWAGSPRRKSPTEPIDIIGPPEGCLCRDIMFNTLDRSGLRYRVVVDTNTMDEAFGAAAAGLGYIGLLRSNVPDTLTVITDNRVLPAMTTTYNWGVYINPQRISPLTQMLADFIVNRMTNVKAAAAPVKLEK